MNLYQLRYFLELAEKRQYTKAARQLNITQPSLSYAISQLENELGVKLFEKDGRTISLTDCGRDLAGCASDSLAILDKGIANLKRKAAGAGKIRLGFLRTLGTDYIPDLASRYLKQNPDKETTFSFHTGSTGALLESLNAGEYDIVFSSEPPESNDFHYTPVMKQDLVLIVPDGHPLADQYRIPLSETLAYPYIYFDQSAGLRYVTDLLFEQIGQKPEIVYETDEDQVIAGLVAHGFGIALVPYMELLLRLNVRILQISYPECQRDIYMVTSRRHELSPAAHHFREFVLTGLLDTPHS